MLKVYLKELSITKRYTVIIALGIIFSYSVYLFLKEDIISDLGKEDHFFEWLTAISFFMATVVYLKIFFVKRNIFYLLLAIVFFVGGGEEISWGQRLIGFVTPAEVKNSNVQQEFNIHNLDVFNTENFNHSRKHGLQRLIEINFLFRIFCMSFGILLPLVAFHIAFTKKYISQLKIPIPPISIGGFFMASWLAYYFIVRHLPLGKQEEYYYTSGEIFEFLCSFIILIIGIYFYQHKDDPIEGKDIKEYI